jgi:uncharacterized protein (UPF0276 family)
VDGARPGAQVGIGLRAPHYAQVAETLPDLAFLEVHSENYFGEGGAALAWLERLRASYPLSLHGVGLSLGSADPLDERHVSRLAALVARFEPMLVSEHLSWSSIGGHHANDLLPLPFTEEALDHVVAKISQAQDRLGCAILVENVSTYVSLPHSAIPEAEFVAEAVRRSGCALLLDVNNVWVNAANHGFDPRGYLAALDGVAIGEMHLAGFERAPGMLVDTHSAPVAEEVWSLYADAIARFGPHPTLIEWDADIPPLDTLLGEAARARKVAA